MFEVFDIPTPNPPHTLWLILTENRLREILCVWTSSRSGEGEIVSNSDWGHFQLFLFTHNVPPSFTITLVSSASRNVFKDNTLANLKNLLSEEINFQGKWRVAVTETTLPAQINNVTDINIVYYKKDHIIASMKVKKDKISRPYLGKTAKLTKREYTSIEQILDEIRRKTDLLRNPISLILTTKHLFLWLHYWEGITFSRPQILSLLGFKGVRDGDGYHRLQTSKLET